MCDSIMMIAHGVMLTCDLVYNRCNRNCLFKCPYHRQYPSTDTMVASLALIAMSSTSSRRSTPRSGCTNISCATSQTHQMESWQSIGEQMSIRNIIDPSNTFKNRLQVILCYNDLGVPLKNYGHGLNTDEKNGVRKSAPQCLFDRGVGGGGVGSNAIWAMPLWKQHFLPMI